MKRRRCLYVAFKSLFPINIDVLTFERKFLKFIVSKQNFKINFQCERGLTASVFSNTGRQLTTSFIGRVAACVSRQRKRREKEQEMTRETTHIQVRMMRRETRQVWNLDMIDFTARLSKYQAMQIYTVNRGTGCRIDLRPRRVKLSTSQEATNKTCDLHVCHAVICISACRQHLHCKGPHCTGFIIPSTHGYKRMRNRFR